MKERIQEFINVKGISPGELASLLEVQRSNISHILNGRNKPGASFIEKMLLVFPELNARWLFTGEGSMFDTKPSIVDTKIEFPEAIQKKAEPKPQNEIPSIPSNSKQIDKIILLYTDGTFVSYKK